MVASELQIHLYFCDWCHLYTGKKYYGPLAERLRSVALQTAQLEQSTPQMFLFQDSYWTLYAKTEPHSYESIADDFSSQENKSILAIPNSYECPTFVLYFIKVASINHHE